MNKKFSTLVASFLLAGGLFSSANAETLMEAAKDANQYYFVKVNAGSAVSNNATPGNLDLTSTAVIPSSDNTGKDAWWRVETVSKDVNGTDVVLGYKLINAVTGKALSVTVGNNTYDVLAIDGGALGFVNAPAEKWYTGSSTKLSSQLTEAWYYDLQAVEPVAQSAADLNAVLGNGFGIQIGGQTLNSAKTAYNWSEYTSYEGGNVFAGTLYAADADNNGNVDLYQGSANGKRIVLTKSNWDVATSELGLNNKFAAWTKKEYDSNKKYIAADEFKISIPAIVAGEPIEVVAVKADGTALEVVVSTISSSNGNVNRLTVNTDTNAGYADYTKSYNGKTETSSSNNTYIKLGVSSMIDTEAFIGKLWNIQKNGKTLSPNCNNTFVAASEVNLNGAEGLWLWTAEAGNTGYFTNRESGATWSIPTALYETETEYVYVDADENVYTFTAAGDPAPKGTLDGYLSGYSDDMLKQKAFFIGTPRSTGDTVYLAKASNGVVTFSLDKADAIEFRLTREVFGLDKNDKEVKEAQLLTNYSYWKDEAIKEQNDVVKLYQYSIEEAVSGSDLCYDATNGYYKIGGTSEEKYVLKSKGADDYNILLGVTVTLESNKKETYLVNKTFCTSAEDNVQKLYGAHNVGRLVKSDDAYSFTENDLFVVVDADAQQYRGDFSNEGALDTIKIFRNDDNSYVLYEKGALLETKDEVLEGFLGMENIYDPQYAEVNAAMVADTAIHANTYRPWYMLAVETNVVPAGKYCDIHGANAGCKDEHLTETRGYTEGRYLVNLVDSANACTNPRSNKFTYETYNGDEPYYRLGFVAAKHMGDSLIINSTNEIIKVNNDNMQACKFAFKYVDGNRDAFTIETLYQKGTDTYGDRKYSNDTKGYIKYHNGVPVVTPKASEAWVFDLEVLENVIPTANETIAASAVTVIAGEGNVTIAGAAGKKVVIANILGQTIANTVLTSDNATIAAPAGVVVVAVEGEAAVKAIVK